LHRLLEIYPEMMIGEIGLDGTHPNLEQQANIFEICLKIAYKYKRPVHIHGHKAWSNILHFLKCYPNTVCILHRFGGNDALVRQFLKFPHVYFSVMQAKPVRYIPDNRLFVESDAPDGLNFSEKIIDFIQQNQINPNILYQNLIQFSELFPALKPYINKGNNL
ncbi:MAG: TatD family hydrolase, partial [Alphaproteobacteria bacterium]|nr:TatD family hydrolase [Alphaproteobacteria bacterium]